MIYLDNAATAKLCGESLEAMLPFLKETYFNPSSVYTASQQTHAQMDAFRENIASSLGAAANEIFFTSGGSEADNWAIKGAAAALRQKGNHIITSKIEHHAVLHTCEFLEKNGFDVTYIGVDENGILDLEQLKNAITDKTILISVMFANNEIGTIQPVREIGRIAHENGILFHTDAVQAFGQLPIDVNEMNIDLLSASGHKLGGPRGIGLLYIRKGVRLEPLVHGGAQESGRRAGTENTAAIAGFSAAVTRKMEKMREVAAYETQLRDYLIREMLEKIPYARLNGHPDNRLPNNANFSFRFVEGESLLMMLDMKGICASSGSACTSGSLDPSHVLLAIGLPHEIAHGSLRLTLSEENTKEEIDFTVQAVKDTVERLREMSPLYEDFIKEKKDDKCTAKKY